MRIVDAMPAELRQPSTAARLITLVGVLGLVGAACDDPDSAGADRAPVETAAAAEGALLGVLELDAAAGCCPPDSPDDIDWTRAVAVVGPVVDVIPSPVERADPAAEKAGEATSAQQMQGRGDAVIEVHEVLAGSLPDGTGATIQTSLPGRLAVSTDEARARAASVGRLLWVLMDETPGSGAGLGDGLFWSLHIYYEVGGEVWTPEGRSVRMMAGAGATTLDELVAAFRAH